MSCEHRHDRSHRADASSTSPPRQPKRASRKPPADRCSAGLPSSTARNYFSDSGGRFFAGVWESTPGRWRVRYTENEFCHITRGRVRIADAGGRQWTFKAGDSFVIPAGFAGTWEVIEPTAKLYVIYEPAAFLVRREFAFAPKWGVHSARVRSAPRDARAARGWHACCISGSGPAVRACFLGNNKGTHHETSEDSGCARTARCGGGGERTSVIHLDSHERLRFPRIQSVGQGSGGSGEHRLRPRIGLVHRRVGQQRRLRHSDVDYEVDLYTGFSGGAEDGLGWDVGLIYYAIPTIPTSTTPRSTAASTYDWFKGKLWYSNDFGGDLTDGDTSAIYIEANATFPLPQNFSLLLHAGLSTGDYWDDVNGDDVIDYSVGVGYEIGHFNLALKYVDTDTDVVVEDDVFNNEGRVIFTIATTFPWSRGMRMSG